MSHLPTAFRISALLAACTATLGCGGDVGSEALIVDATYSRLEAYAAAGGAELAFEIGPVDTFYKADFTERAWLDVVTPPEGDRIAGKTRTHEETVDGLTTRWASFVPSWEREDTDWSDTEEGRIARVSTVEDLLLMVAEDKVEALQIGAVSTFEVTVWLDGAQRTYDAAFLWLDGAEGDTASFYPVDYVVPGLEWGSHQALPAFVAERPDVSASSKVASRKCEPYTEDYGPIVVEGSGAADHITGEHSGYAELSGSCECTARCTSICTGEVSEESCEDSGMPLWWSHYMAMDSDSSSAVSQNGGTTCAAAFACTATSCPFLILCHGEVTVKVDKTEVTFDLDPEAMWKIKDSLTIECAACDGDATVQQNTLEVGVDI